MQLACVNLACRNSNYYMETPTNIITDTNQEFCQFLKDKFDFLVIFGDQEKLEAHCKPEEGKGRAWRASYGHWSIVHHQQKKKHLKTLYRLDLYSEHQADMDKAISSILGNHVLSNNSSVKAKHIQRECTNLCSFDSPTPELDRMVHYYLYFSHKKKMS